MAGVMQRSLRQFTSINAMAMGTMFASLIASLVVWNRYSAGAFLSPNLHAWLDPAADPHLLSRHLLHLFLQKVNYNAETAFLANMIAMLAAVLIVAGYAFATRVKDAGAFALAAAASICLTPFSAGLLYDPLGCEALLSLALFCCVVQGSDDNERPVNFGLAIAATVWIVLQEPVLLPALGLYMFISASVGNDRRRTWLGAICIFGLGYRLVLAHPGSLSVDPYSGAYAIVAFGAFCFALTPVVVYAFLNVDALRGVSPPRWDLYVIGGVLLLSPALPGSVDYSLAWAASAITFVLAFKPAIGHLNDIPRSVAFFFIGAIALLITWSAMGQGAPSARWHREAQSVKSAISNLKGNTCIVGGLLGADRSVAQDFGSLYAPDAKIASAVTPEKCQGIASGARLLTISADNSVTDWGPTGGQLVLAAKAAEGGNIIPVDHGSAAPLVGAKVRSAFTYDFSTPTGKVRALTVVAGYKYRIKCVDTRVGTMTYAVGNPLSNLPSAQPVAYSIVVQSPKSELQKIDTGVVLPQADARAVRWDFRSVRVKNPNGCSDVIFAAWAPNGRAIATWATFVAPALSR